MFRFRLIALYIYLLASVATCMAQATIPAASAIRIAFYNTENLFHPDNDSLTLDDEFTPDGKLHWTYNRYRIKLQHISKVLMAMGGWNGLAIAGMCELENRQVLEDLLKYTPLSNGNWGIVHHDSPDHRGIDVGLIYNRQCFTVISDRACLVRPPGSQLHTRDILYVKGVLNGSDTLHIMVNHWPSRRGGAETSEPKRVYAGQVLKFLADSILQKQPSAMILAMGDFNDGPGNASIRQLIDTGVTFRHTMLPQDPFSGSHKFAGDWELLDQILVSPNLLDGVNDWQACRGQVFTADFLMEDDKGSGGVKPLRTYAGPNYIGGFSDHLPVWIELSKIPQP